MRPLARDRGWSRGAAAARGDSARTCVVETGLTVSRSPAQAPTRSMARSRHAVTQTVGPLANATSRWLSLQHRHQEFVP